MASPFRLQTAFACPTEMVPFGPAEVAVALKPAALLSHDGRVAAVDANGQPLALEWPQKWNAQLPDLLPPAGEYALFGLLDLTETGLRLRCLSVVSGALAWAHGPVFDVS
ncbi:MAG: hypothetical protein HY332_14545 [Chloroflexi bacterium]|nr:hypothetical protein [Chloroflexota bacterium]